MILKVAGRSGGHAAMARALSDAGIGVVEVEDWDCAAEALRDCSAALVVRDGDLPDSGDVARLAKAVTALANGKPPDGPAPEVLRSLSHDLRTPLSAMAGWLHLMQSGKLDAAGLQRAITKLSGNIDDQVKTIDRYLGATTR
jgi:hypothetical protein